MGFARISGALSSAGTSGDEERFVTPKTQGVEGFDKNQPIEIEKIVSPAAR